MARGPEDPMFYNTLSGNTDMEMVSQDYSPKKGTRRPNNFIEYGRMVKYSRVQ